MNWRSLAAAGLSLMVALVLYRHVGHMVWFPRNRLETLMVLPLHACAVAGAVGILAGVPMAKDVDRESLVLRAVVSALRLAGWIMLGVGLALALASVLVVRRSGGQDRILMDWYIALVPSSLFALFVVLRLGGGRLGKRLSKFLA
jgi:hypothetical protein